MRAERQGRLTGRVAASRTIVVAGAGIGGLTASLALAGQGFRVIVLEKTERLEEAGAGLQLSPNASRVLIDLGLQPRLTARAVTPDAISIMSARRGGEIARLPLGEAATLRAGAPYWVMHRADLQAALQAQVNDHPDIELRLGCQFEDVVPHAKGLTVVQRSGTMRQQVVAVALVGADGIWSAVRHHLFPQVQPQFSGLIAWRGTIDASQLPREYASCRVQLWMGPEAHLVAYPISGARQINVVAVVPGTWNRPGWSAPVVQTVLNLRHKVFRHVDGDTPSVRATVQDITLMLLARQTSRAILANAPAPPQAQRTKSRRPKIRRFTLQPARDIKGRFRINMLHVRHVRLHTRSSQAKSHGKNRKKHPICSAIMRFATETS